MLILRFRDSMSGLLKLGLAAVLLTSLVTLPAHATPEEEGRKLFEEGLAQEARGAAACENFRKALELIRELGPLSKVKECDVRENKLLGARTKLRELIGRWPEQDAELEGLKQELSAIESRIPRLTLTAKADAPQGMKVRVDGSPVTLPTNDLELDPGEHEVLVDAEGRPLTRIPITLTSGEKQSLELTPQAAPQVVVAEDKPSTLGIVGIVIGGVGVAGVIGGAITGGLVLDKQAEYDAYEACPEECVTLKEEGETLILVNGVLFIAGAATAVLGGTLLIIDLAGSESTSSAALQLGPGRMDWIVRF